MLQKSILNRKHGVINMRVRLPQIGGNKDEIQRCFWLDVSYHQDLSICFRW